MNNNSNLFTCEANYFFEQTILTFNLIVKVGEWSILMGE